MSYRRILGKNKKNKKFLRIHEKMPYMENSRGKTARGASPRAVHNISGM